VKKRLVQLFLFIMTLTLEVRVHAKEIISLPNDPAPLLLPNDCLPSLAECAIGTAEETKYKLKNKEQILTLGSATVLVRQDSSHYTLISGMVWIKTKTALDIKTEFGHVSSGQGEFWVSLADEKVWVQAVEGSVVVIPRGSQSKVEVEEGHENWLGPVQKNGVAEMGLPRPISFTDYLARWARLYPGTKKQFKKEAEALRLKMAPAAQADANYYSELVERQVAALHDQEAERAKARKIYEDHEKELRMLFRRKTLDQ
jgi:hypothetical protein